MKLHELVSEDLIQLGITADGWEDAIRKSAAPLVSHGKCRQGYVDDMIEGLDKYGPYFVLAKHVALPHARPASGAIENAMAITVLSDPVVSGNKANDPVKYLFTLSATGGEEHLEALATLVGLLSDSSFFDLLDRACDGKEIISYIRKIEGGKNV